MRWLKPFITAFIALQMLFAPEVCLMLCCHAPVIKDEADLPACHRRQPTQTSHPTEIFNAPCNHTHDEKPVARQRANDEAKVKALVAVAVSRHCQQALNIQLAAYVQAVRATASPPFRASNLLLRV